MPRLTTSASASCSRSAAISRAFTRLSPSCSFFGPGQLVLGKAQSSFAGAPLGLDQRLLLVSECACSMSGAFEAVAHIEFVAQHRYERRIGGGPANLAICSDRSCSLGADLETVGLSEKVEAFAICGKSRRSSRRWCSVVGSCSASGAAPLSIRPASWTLRPARCFSARLWGRPAGACAGLAASLLGFAENGWICAWPGRRRESSARDGERDGCRGNAAGRVSSLPPGWAASFGGARFARNRDLALPIPDTARQA